MQSTINDHYSNKISTLEFELRKIKKQLTLLYIIRLFTFISFVFFLILLFHLKFRSLFIILSVISFVLFLLAIKLDFIVSYKKKFQSNKLLLNQNELKFIDFQYDERETGDEYNFLNHHLAADFNLFGKGSLFQYLNRCSTKIGKNKLAEGLCQSQTDEKLIKEKQQAIKELSEKNEFIQNFQTHGMFILENNNESINLKLWLDQPIEKNNLLKLLCIVIPLMNIIWITMIIFGVFTSSSIVFPVVFNLYIVFFNVKKINNAHSKLGKTAKTFEKYTTLIKLVEDESFKSSYLQELQKKLFYQDIKASNSLRSLFKLLNSFDLRFNFIVSFVLNALLLFDIQVYCRLMKWKEKHKNIVSLWFTALSDVDSLISFSIYAFNNQNAISYPKTSNKNFIFQAVEMGHPLLPTSVRICNDIYFSGTPSVIIITGANMAGKSTFLRTLSVNLILAMNGAPVCAKDFEFTPCDIMSSIKIQDSLLNNESYFYAELLRIKEIIDHAKTNRKTLVILDEILRGTNTKDKQLGSLGLLEKLISLNSVVIIATHDLVIGDLEKKYPKIVVNNCFEVELTNDQLIFDYKLKQGISQKLNASFLMRKMEIIN